MFGVSISPTHINASCSALQCKSVHVRIMKMNKGINFTFRLSKAEKAQLEKEAALDSRTLAAYIRLLIETHPKRVKK